MNSMFLDDTTENISALEKEWGWLLIAGVALMLLGLGAFAVPVATSVGLTYGLATVFVVSGVIHFINAIRLRHQVSAAMRFLRADLAVIIGLLMFRYPAGGLLGIALALSFYFFISSAVQWVTACERKAKGGRGFGMLSSFISFALGVFIILTYPFSALWVPGVLLGIELIFAGVGMIGIAFAARRHLHHQAAFQT